MKGKKVRRLSAIMFTDIVGYTALMQKDESAAAKVRIHHRREFKKQHEIYHGEILQYYGDGTLSVFKSGVEAVECAVAIQKTLGEEETVPLRIGLHIGDIVFDGTEIYGDGVNLASRIEGLGQAGSILISGKLNDELKNHLRISTLSLGHFELKNIAKPVEVFTVTNDGVKTLSRSDIKEKRKDQTKSIAVLPFTNMSSSEDNEYFSDGMTEEIINALSRIKGLKVTSRTSSFFFKNKHLPLPEIGRELNVSTILEGSVRLSGKKMRITAQLIDVTNDYHFWTETFDRSIEDVFAVQDEISLLIADRLREHLGHLDIEDHLVEAPGISVDLYTKYLKGKYHILRIGKDDIEKGISILKEIVEEQPDFSLAYLGIHQGYVILGTTGLVPAHEVMAKGKPFLDKAIELDPNLPESQLNLAWTCFLQDWDLTGTYRHLNKALEIRPVVEFYQSMASTLVVEGKFTAASNYIDTALQIDPFSAINCHLKGFIYYLDEKYLEAIEWFKKSIALQSNYTLSGLYWGEALLLMGRKAEALAFFQKLPADEPKELTKLAGVTLAYAAMGDLIKAEQGIKELRKALLTDSAERVIILLILCHTIIGSKEIALDLIEKGIDDHLPMMIYVFTEPILKPLRSDSRFQKMMRSVLGQETDFGFPKRKYKKPLFDKDILQQHQQRLDHLMVEKKPFFDPKLTLRKLAKMLEMQPNHLSQLLNEGFDKNFAEYVNAYRLEAFKKKAADFSQHHLTILSLAYDSGFNSKTVFNTFFKKIMGITPKVYWKKLLKK